MGGGGFLGFLETPWGSPRFFPSFYNSLTAWPNVDPTWLQQVCQWILIAAGQSRPSSESPQFQYSRQKQNHQFSFMHHISLMQSRCYCCNCLPQIALEALSEHENTKKISGAPHTRYPLVTYCAPLSSIP